VPAPDSRRGRYLPTYYAVHVCMLCMKEVYIHPHNMHCFDVNILHNCRHDRLRSDEDRHRGLPRLDLQDVLRLSVREMFTNIRACIRQFMHRSCMRRCR
jgi:hypothetical protein